MRESLLLGLTLCTRSKSGRFARPRLAHTLCAVFRSRPRVVCHLLFFFQFALFTITRRQLFVTLLSNQVVVVVVVVNTRLAILTFFSTLLWLPFRPTGPVSSLGLLTLVLTIHFLYDTCRERVSFVDPFGSLDAIFSLRSRAALGSPLALVPRHCTNKIFWYFSPV